jgi:hypothetical protein
MLDIQNVIMRDIEADPTIDSKKIAIEIQAKGFLRKRKIIRLTGSAKSETEKKKVMQTVVHFAGDKYDVANNLIIKT